jgi:hypothetical protein
MIINNRAADQFIKNETHQKKKFLETTKALHSLIFLFQEWFLWLLKVGLLFEIVEKDSFGEY